MPIKLSFWWVPTIVNSGFTSGETGSSRPTLWDLPASDNWNRCGLARLLLIEEGIDFFLNCCHLFLFSHRCSLLSGSRSVGLSVKYNSLNKRDPQRSHRIIKPVVVWLKREFPAYSDRFCEAPSSPTSEIQSCWLLKIMPTIIATPLFLSASSPRNKPLFLSEGHKYTKIFDGDSFTFTSYRAVYEKEALVME